MRLHLTRRSAAALLGLLAWVAPAWAQTQTPPVPPPGTQQQAPPTPPATPPATQPPQQTPPQQQQPPPRSILTPPAQQATQQQTDQLQAQASAQNLPPANSPPLLRTIEFRFHPVNEPGIDITTYDYYLALRPSSPSNRDWKPYKEDDVLAGFQRLWDTHFLDNLWVEVLDEPYSNGVMGKHVIYHMEERQRIKIVDYAGSKQVDQSKIEDELKKRGVEVRLDSFIDQTTLKHVSDVVRDLYADKGYEDATVTTKIVPMDPSNPKLIHLTFNIDQGPKFQIKSVQWIGNASFGNGTLNGQLKDNKPHGWLSFLTGSGTYQESKFADDAQRVEEFYQNEGYAQVRVGAPQIQVLGTSKDNKTRWISLKIPIDEGPRFRVGTISFAENTVVKDAALRPIFKIEPGDYFNRKALQKGFEKARELYGQIGYYDFTGYPETKVHGAAAATSAGGGPNAEAPAETADAAQPAGAGQTATSAGQTATGAAQAAPAAPGAKTADNKKAPPTLDIVLHMEEGTQYFVNRITFLGNTTTRDSVIRRELRLVEGGVLDTEALKYSIRRLNQLGYFKPLEDTDNVKIEKVPGTTNKMDVSIKFDEQNRNQITFGAGVSQFEGFFGQLGFQTSNFLGRGETVSINLQQGSLAKNYELAVTEPFLFDRPVTAGVDLFTRTFIYQLQFTQVTTGGTTSVGLPIHPFSRMNLGYSYEDVSVKDINPAYLTPTILASNPYLADSLLVNVGGERTISKVSPSFILHNTINSPIYPMNGQRYTLGLDIAGVGGNTQFLEGSAEGIWYIPFSRRTSLAIRAQGLYSRPYGSTQELPIFEKIFLGGEYSIRGFDLRTVGPYDPVSHLVIGGNKSVLLNMEYIVAIAGPVRLLAFYDAGQVQDVGTPLRWKDPIYQSTLPPPPALTDPTLSYVALTPGNVSLTQAQEIIGQTSAFKTSTGLELRFFMPVLNIPFRLIAAYNPQRFGVYNNNGVLTPRFTFRFAVGTTF